MISFGDLYSKDFIIWWVYFILLYLSFWIDGESFCMWSWFVSLLLALLSILKWKFLNFTVEKDLKALTWGQKAVREKVGRSHCHSHWKSRENNADVHQIITEGFKVSHSFCWSLQNIALYYGLWESVHWGIFHLWAQGVLWATRSDCVHSQYKCLLEACTRGNSACSLWVTTHFYSLRSGTAGKTTDPFLLGSL